MIPTSSLPLLEAWLRDRLAGPLPGPSAQRRFAPLRTAEEWAPDLTPATARHAATLLLLYPGAAGPSVALTVRHDGLPQHAGQVSLPGGAIDPGESVEAAALREAEEEIGLTSGHVQLVGALSTLWLAVSNFVIHPIVGIADATPAFRPHPHEVAELIEVPLAELLDPARLLWSSVERSGGVIDYPYFNVGHQHVWGATAIMLGEFACLFEPEHAPPAKPLDPIAPDLT